MKKKFKTTNRGYTLIELSIGLAVTSLVLSGVVMGVEKMLRTQATTKTITQVASTIDQIQLMTRRDPDSSFVTMQNLSSGKNNVFGSYTINGGKVYSALGNEIELVSKGNMGWTGYGNGAEGYLTNDQLFGVVLKNIDSRTCLDLVNGLDGVSDGIYIVGETGAGRIGQLGNAKIPGQRLNVSVVRSYCIDGDRLIFQARK